MATLAGQPAPSVQPLPPPSGGGGLPRTTGALAAAIGARLIGRDDLPIDDLNTLDAAGPRTLSFIRNEVFAAKWPTCKAAGAIVTRGLTVPGHDPASRALLEVADADTALIKVLELFAPPAPTYRPGIHPTAIVDPGATIAPTAHVGPYCIISAGAAVADGVILVAHNYLGTGAIVGPGTFLHPSVTILDRCIIGAKCILWTGVVIGSDGFGYRPSDRGPLKIPHIGNVIVGNMVEIGSNTCIDRGKFGATTIGDATKIDNLVQIAHNCSIGRGVIICGGCGVAGSVTIEDGVILAGQAGVVDNLTIGKGAVISAQAGVTKDVPAGETWFGMPAGPHKEQMRAHVALRKLSDHLRLLKKIEKIASIDDAIKRETEKQD